MHLPTILFDLPTPSAFLPLLCVQLCIEAPCCGFSHSMLRSLGGLSLLRQLDLGLDLIRPAQLQQISCLVNLRSCSIGLPLEECDDDNPHRPGCLTLFDVAACFALTQLTQLCLRTVQHAAPLLPADAAAERLAIGPLANLTSLQHLSLGHMFLVDDCVFPAIRQLTRLTHLSVGRVELSHPRPGHLPLLQDLHVQRSLSSTQALQTLLPFLPLPCLAFSATAECRLEVSYTDDEAPQAAALKRVAQCLAAAPVLNLQSLSLACHPQRIQMSIRSIVQGLEPFAISLQSLTLEDLSNIGAEWGMLSSAMLRMRELYLDNCTLTDVGLAVLTSRWPSLTTLKMAHCQGITSEGWLVLAAERADALTLRILPPLETALQGLMQSAQLSHHNVQSLTFMPFV